MKFNKIEDVKNFVTIIKEKFASNIEMYNRLAWFENVNYTTTSEYYGELLILLDEIVELKEINELKGDVIELIKVLQKIFN